MLKYAYSEKRSFNCIELEPAQYRELDEMIARLKDSMKPSRGEKSEWKQRDNPGQERTEEERDQ